MTTAQTCCDHDGKPAILPGSRWGKPMGGFVNQFAMKLARYKTYVEHFVTISPAQYLC
jgi:hypothetical protein